jgi:hypothetical protein
MGTVNWGGHEFTVCDPENTVWEDVAGVYIFAGIEADGFWHASYIGIAHSFRDRIPNHDRWAEARMRGATHIHALPVRQGAMRAHIEQTLIVRYHPYLNTHYR